MHITLGMHKLRLQSIYSCELDLLGSVHGPEYDEYKQPMDLLQYVYLELHYLFYSKLFNLSVAEPMQRMYAWLFLNRYGNEPILSGMP